jgi:hypothetical protein
MGRWEDGKMGRLEDWRIGGLEDWRIYHPAFKIKH